jgi:hypothetical protein
VGLQVRVDLPHLVKLLPGGPLGRLHIALPLETVGWMTDSGSPRAAQDASKTP